MPLTRTTTVGEVMHHPVHSIGHHQKLAKAHELMREHDLRHLPVLREGKLVGILTQRDLYFLETIHAVDVDIDSVADAMTPEVYTATKDESLRHVTRVMAEHRYGCAVVVDSGDRLLGIFTATDALDRLSEMLA